jgi:hypothetical protein
MAYIGAYSVAALSADGNFNGLPIDFMSSLGDAGIKFSLADDVASYTAGLHGGGVHNIKSGEHGTLTLTVLAGSPADVGLETVYQSLRAGAMHPKNCAMTIRDGSNKQTHVFNGLAVRSKPEKTYGNEIGQYDWVLQFSQVVTTGGI